MNISLNSHLAPLRKIVAIGEPHRNEIRALSLISRFSLMPARRPMRRARRTEPAAKPAAKDTTLAEGGKRQRRWPRRTWETVALPSQAQASSVARNLA